MRRNTSTRLKLCEVSSATHTRAMSQGPKVHFAALLVSVHFTLQREFRKLHSADGSVHFALNYSFASSASATPRLLAELRSAVARHPSHPYFPYHLLIKNTVDIPLSRKLTKDVTTVFSTTTSCISCI